MKYSFYESSFFAGAGIDWAPALCRPLNDFDFAIFTVAYQASIAVQILSSSFDNGDIMPRELKWYFQTHIVNWLYDLVHSFFPVVCEIVQLIQSSMSEGCIENHLD